MGTQLNLNEREFDALDMLVSFDGEPLSFERLFEAVWGEGEGSLSPDEAQAEIDDLIDQVEEAGEGFMRIEFSPDAGYSFLTNWGHNWHSQILCEDTFALPDGILTLPSAPKKQDRRLIATLIVGALAAAAVVVLVLTSVMNELMPDLEIIDERVPLALPDKFVVSTCMEEGGCGNPDACTGEGLCALKEENPETDASVDSETDASVDPETDASGDPEKAAELSVELDPAELDPADSDPVGGAAPGDNPKSADSIESEDDPDLEDNQDLEEGDQESEGSWTPEDNPDPEEDAGD